MIKFNPEILLLALLAVLWGSSYIFIRIAVAEFPPLTLIAGRVTGAGLFLLLVLWLKGESLPRGRRVWRMLLVQSFLNSFGAWTVLAWGQQYVSAGLASVLNSVSPIFVYLISVFILRNAPVEQRKLLGALIGCFGVVLIVGIDVLAGLGQQVVAQLACLAGALMYAGAALYGRRFAKNGALATACGTMIWASVVLVPLALLVDRPWLLHPGPSAIAATLVLSVLCTGVALLIYFRLLHRIGPMGVASQSYLRAGVGVVLGLVFLGESISSSAVAGVAAAIQGVVLINWPAGRINQTTKGAFK